MSQEDFYKSFINNAFDTLTAAFRQQAAPPQEPAVPSFTSLWTDPSGSMSSGLSAAAQEEMEFLAKETLVLAAFKTGILSIEPFRAATK